MKTPTSTLPNMDEVIANERIRLNGDRETLVAQRDAIDSQIGDLDQRLRAIVAYETTLTGPPPGKPATARSRSTPAATPGGGRASKATEIITLLRGITTGDGLTRGDIIERLGVKGDASGEGAVSNALTVLKRDHKVHQPTKGRYLIAPDQTPAGDTNAGPALI